MMQTIEGGKDFHRVVELDPHPRRKVAHLDLDDTLFPGLLLEPLVHDQMREGLFSMANAIPLMHEIRKYKSGAKGQASNVTKLNQYWLDGCKDTPYLELVTHAIDFVHRNRDSFAPYTGKVFETFKKHGYDVWVDTGEPPFAAQAVIEEFKGTGFCATQWKTEWRNGVLVATSIEKPMTSNQKGAWAEELFTDAPGQNGRKGYSRKGSIALIDSRNDMGLASAVEYSVICGNPPPELLGHFERIGKTFAIASPDNVVYLVNRMVENAKEQPQIGSRVFYEDGHPHRSHFDETGRLLIKRPSWTAPSVADKRPTTIFSRSHQ